MATNPAPEAGLKGVKTLWHGGCIVSVAMNSKHPESETLAFIEALAGEYAGANSTCRSWRQRACDLSQEFIAAFEADLCAPVVF